MCEGLSLLTYVYKLFLKLQLRSLGSASNNTKTGLMTKMLKPAGCWIQWIVHI